MTSEHDKYKREDLQDIGVMESVIVGYLMRSYNKVAVGTYNKIATSLGLDKRKKADLVELTNLIEEEENYYNWFDKALNGEIDVEDLESYNSFAEEEPKKPIKDKGIHSVVAPYVVANEKVLANNREFVKAQKTGAHTELLIEGLKEHLTNELTSHDLTKPRYFTVSDTIKPSDKELIVGLSDWHIGALVVNKETGGYNFDILLKRLETVIESAIQTIEEQGISHVHLYFIGDLIEHINMRNVNQAFEAQYPATEQIAKGVRLLYDTIVSLASRASKVTFGIVGGNHDRFQGNKADKVFNDNVSYLALDMLFMMQELESLPSNVALIDNREDIYSFIDTVANKTVKVVHGDAEGKKEDVKIRKHIRKDDINYLIMGHIHTTRIIQEDYSRFHVYVGSTMGANNYSSENNMPSTSPAQFLMVLDSKKDQPVFNPIIL